MAFEISNGQGWYKTRYGQKNTKLPLVAKLQKAFPFEKRAKTGEQYVEPVLVKSSHGITIKGGTSRGTVYSFNTPSSPDIKQLTVNGCEITLRDQIAIGAVAAAIGGDASYGPIVDEIVVQLSDSHRFYIELGLMHGQSTDGIGFTTAAAATGADALLTISAATWAPGIWARGEGMRLDAYDGATLLNDSAAGAFFVVKSINYDARQLVLSGEASDITALIAAGAGTTLSVSASTGVTGMFTGVKRIVTNTGELHGIDAALHSVWRGNRFNAASAAITLGLIHRASVTPVNRGVESRIDWHLPTAAWARIVNDESALRRYADGREYKQGATKLQFYGANGEEGMSLNAHSMIMESEAYGLTTDDWLRGGESDLVDNLPGTPDDQFFHNVPGMSALEILNFSSQFLICRKPYKQVQIYGADPAAA